MPTRPGPLLITRLRPSSRAPNKESHAVISDPSLLLKCIPDSVRSRSVFLGRARDLRSEPTHELGVHHGTDILRRCAFSKPRQDRADLRLVLIGVGFEVDTDRILFKENPRDVFVEALEPPSKL